MITTARYLAALWRTPCYDCWEERGTDVHISTLGAIYAGGVARRGPIANPLSWTHAQYLIVCHWQAGTIDTTV